MKYTVDFITEYKNILKVRDFLKEKMNFPLIFDDEPFNGEKGILAEDEDGFYISCLDGPNPISLASALAKHFNTSFATEVLGSENLQRQMAMPDGNLFWVDYDDDVVIIQSSVRPVSLPTTAA